MISLEEDADGLALENSPLAGPPLLVWNRFGVPVGDQEEHARVLSDPQFPELRRHQVEEGCILHKVLLVVLDGYQLRDDVRRAKIRARSPD